MELVYAFDANDKNELKYLLHIAREIRGVSLYWMLHMKRERGPLMSFVYLVLTLLLLEEGMFCGSTEVFFDVIVNLEWKDPVRQILSI